MIFCDFDSRLNEGQLLIYCKSAINISTLARKTLIVNWDFCTLKKK